MVCPIGTILQAREQWKELENPLYPTDGEHLVKPNIGQWKIVDPEYANYVPTYKRNQEKKS